MILTKPILLYIIGISILLFISCQPTDTLQPDAVPANLLASAQVDSVITLTEKVDFSTISEIGQGPKGTLIRWDYEGSPSGTFQANTYDAQSRLIGTLGISYGYQVITKYRYQGDLLAENFYGYRSDLAKPLSEVRPTGVIKRQYNPGKQLTKELIYRRVSTSDTFELTHITQYEYNSTGQIQLTRLTYREKPGPTMLINYWHNGDCTREELYYPANENTPFPIIAKHTYQYDQQANPYADKQHVISAHNVIRNTSFSSSENPFYTSQYVEDQYDYDQQYDDQGHVIRQRTRSLLHNPDHWSAWRNPTKFTYAP